MINDVIKCGAIAILAALIVVQGTHESASTTLQFDEATFEYAHHSLTRQAGSETRWARPWPTSNARAAVLEADDADQFVLLRASTEPFPDRTRPFDTGLLTATPGGRMISDTYDFAGLDPDSFAAIKPVKLKRQRGEKSETPEGSSATPRDEVLGLGAKTLGYFVLNTKILLENLLRTIYRTP